MAGKGGAAEVGDPVEALEDAAARSPAEYEAYEALTARGVETEGAAEVGGAAEV